MAYDPSDPLYQMLLDEDITAFNQARKEGKTVDLQGALFRGIDLRNLDAEGLDMTGAYFRGADLRGVDFRNTILEGASLCEAKISGCYFPKQLSPDEIRLSLEKGTRMRYN
jgi:uncharacterized protein YjbI with pentapeptide repeats